MQAQESYDEWLIYRIRTGDRSAFQLLTKRWYLKLIKHIFFLIKDREVAKDLAQDTWSVVLNRLDRLKEPEHFKIWMFRIARNKSADWIKQEQKKRDYKNEIRNTTDEYEIDYEEGDNSNIVKLRKAMKNLSETEQQILNLFYIEDCNIREINRILNIPVGTVKSRLFTAREHLKKVLTA